MSKSVTHITPKGLGLWAYIKEVFSYKDLLLTLAYRDLRVRYAQTYLGFAWGIIQPLISLAVIFVLFKRIISVDTYGISYLAFALSGLVWWNYFNYLVIQSASSLINAQQMIKKIYFPRLCLPFSKALGGMLDLGIALIILIIVLMVQGYSPLYLTLFPVFLILTLISALGIGLWVSALSIRLRDLQQILPFFLQLLFFLTPVAYSSTMLTKLIPEPYGWVVYLNPMSGILELFRYFLFGIPMEPYLWVSLLSAALLFFTGIRYFLSTERKMADIL